MTRLLFVLAATLAGCVNVSTLQTARALPPGDGRVLVGGGVYADPTLESNDVLVYGELGYRRGVVDRVELGGKASLPWGTLGLDAKYQVVDHAKFAAAIGLGATYTAGSVTYTDLDEMTNEVPFRYIDTIVPIYLSYDVAKPFAVYAAPKYVLRHATDENVSTFGHLVGGSTGVRLGDRGGVFLEATYLRELTASTFDSFQISGSFFF